MIKEKNRCPHCGRVIDKREIAMFSGLVEALWEIVKWCHAGKSDWQRHEFSMAEVRHMLGQNEYARFGDWVLFGGLVYKTKKAHYGLNMDRCDEFFDGKRSIPGRIWKDQGTGELELIDYKFVGGFPGLIEFLDGDMQYQAKYKKRKKVDEKDKDNSQQKLI